VPRSDKIIKGAVERFLGRYYTIKGQNDREREGAVS